MPQVNAKLLLIGALAGITSALLALGASLQPSLAVMLYAASALPVLIVGLGWGNMAAIISIATAAIVGALGVSPAFAGTLAIFTLLPAGWISHLANLARPAKELGGPDGLLAWYPLSDILFQLCGVISLAVIILGVIIGYGPEFVEQYIKLITESLSQGQPDMAADMAMLEQSARMMLTMLPIVQGGMWVIMLFSAYYFATRIVATSGHSLRPREDMPSALRMNRNSVFIFLGGILLTFVGGVPGLLGAVVCGTFGAGFLMAGFASLHLRLRGKDWRLPALILCYISAIFVLPMMLVLILGVADIRRAVALTPTAGKAVDPTDNKDDN